MKGMLLKTFAVTFAYETFDSNTIGCGGHSFPIPSLSFDEIQQVWSASVDYMFSCPACAVITIRCLIIKTIAGAPSE
jgi:hypothetical protein